MTGIGLGVLRGRCSTGEAAGLRDAGGDFPSDASRFRAGPPFRFAGSFSILRGRCSSPPVIAAPIPKKPRSRANHIGAIMRINPDGSIPPGNPHDSMPGWAPEIWSIGHRNVQGAAMRPATDQFWAHEHGARGGDEVNLIETRAELRLAGHCLRGALFRRTDRCRHA